MQKGTIGVTTDNIFPVIKKFLYSDHEIFLRELVSNAVDATQKLKTLSSFGDFKGELGTMNVTVSIDKNKGTLTISDRGIGMTAEEIIKLLFRRPKSFWKNIKMMRMPLSGISGWDFILLSWFPKK